MQEYVDAYLKNMKRLERRLVEMGGFWQGLVNHGDGMVMGTGPRIRPQQSNCYRDCATGNLTADACAATLRTEWCVAEPEPWGRATSYLMRPPHPDDVQEAGTQATAQFLLTRGNYSWIGYFDWQSLANWALPVEWDRDYGLPHGPCAETGVGTGVFTRSWEKAMVSWDCHTGTGKIEMK
jgi:hypothetical protein